MKSTLARSLQGGPEALDAVGVSGPVYVFTNGVFHALVLAGKARASSQVP